MAVLVRAQHGGKEGRRVEPRGAQPIDGAVRPNNVPTVGGSLITRGHLVVPALSLDYALAARRSATGIR